MSDGVFNRYTGYHNRISIRLRGYDYSKPGYYFITICIHDRKQKLFGDVSNGNIIENEFGKIVHNEILKTEKMRPNISIDEFIIMPNHVHVIINIRRGTLQRAPTEKTAPIIESQHLTKPQTEQFGKPTLNSIPTIIRLIKSTVKKQINMLRKTPGQPVWQRNYYDHIIRDERSLFFIRKYIRDNPMNWKIDSENHIDREIRKFAMTEMGDIKYCIDKELYKENNKESAA
jgi:putative transposase